MNEKNAWNCGNVCCKECTVPFNNRSTEHLVKSIRQESIPKNIKKAVDIIASRAEWWTKRALESQSKANLIRDQKYKQLAQECEFRRTIRFWQSICVALGVFIICGYLLRFLKGI